MLWTSNSLLYIALQSETLTFSCLFFWKRWALEPVGSSWMLHNGCVNYLFLSPILSMYSDVSCAFFFFFSHGKNLTPWNWYYQMFYVMRILLTTLSRPGWHTHIKGRQSLSGYLFINDATFIPNTWSFFCKNSFHGNGYDGTSTMCEVRAFGCISLQFIETCMLSGKSNINAPFLELKPKRKDLQHFHVREQNRLWNIYLKCHLVWQQPMYVSQIIDSKTGKLLNSKCKILDWCMLFAFSCNKVCVKDERKVLCGQGEVTLIIILLLLCGQGEGTLIIILLLSDMYFMK